MRYMVLERMSREEIDFTAAAIEVHEKHSRWLLAEIRDQITLYGKYSREIAGNVFKFVLKGKSVKVERLSKVQ